MKRFVPSIIMLFLILSASALADRIGHSTLLAVSLTDNSTIGSTADLFLEITPGTGRIFIDSYPLVKVDTQFSTRYANKIACDYIDYDCSKYDFFYTINANSPIIGGPSAGAAITTLTIALLLDKPYDETIAITGTINSGGMIGSVGGIPEKIEAAKDAGIKKVIIPKVNSLNATDFLSLMNQTDIDIVEVATLDDVLYETLGIPKSRNDFIVEPEYTKTMHDVAELFCDETKSMIDDINHSTNIYLADNVSYQFYNSSLSLYEKGATTFNDSKYYSAASYCFGAGLKAKEITLKIMGQKELNLTLISTEKELVSFERYIDSIEMRNLWDVQTYMVVKERIIESKENIKEMKSLENISYINLAYSIQRLKSGKSWSRFFNASSKKEDFDKEKLKLSCIDKITEVDTYIEYVRYITGLDFDNIQKEIDLARKDYNNRDYELCLFKASTAKAETTLILSGMELGTKELSAYLNETIISVEKTITKLQEKNASFPIIGYSYYEYAKVLKDDDPVSSLLYLEYASELSNLNLYFNERVYSNNEDKTYAFNGLFDSYYLFIFCIFITGILVGIFLTSIFLHFNKRKKEYVYRKASKNKRI